MLDASAETNAWARQLPDELRASDSPDDASRISIVAPLRLEVVQPGMRASTSGVPLRTKIVAGISMRLTVELKISGASSASV